MRIKLQLETPSNIKNEIISSMLFSKPIILKNLEVTWVNETVCVLSCEETEEKIKTELENLNIGLKIIPYTYFEILHNFQVNDYGEEVEPNTKILLNNEL